MASATSALPVSTATTVRIGATALSARIGRSETTGFERNDRPERGDRPERRERFPRDRRRDEADAPERGTLPAFLTNPVRTPAPVSVEETQAPVSVVQQAANDEEAPRPRRRRRTRQEMIDAANAENGDFTPDPVETPAAE